VDRKGAVVSRFFSNIDMDGYVSVGCADNQRKEKSEPRCWSFEKKKSPLSKQIA
jgi:hypothetical protein